MDVMVIDTFILISVQYAAEQKHVRSPERLDFTRTVILNESSTVTDQKAT